LSRVKHFRDSVDDLVDTTIFLVRNAATAWTRDGRITGRRDLDLSPEGRAQTDQLAAQLARIEISEVLVSPQQHAVQTAEPIAARHGLEVARDPRLGDLAVGAFEGMSGALVSVSEDYRRWLDGNALSGVEPLADARDRMLASLTQALADSELGANVVLVSHAGPLRLLLAHALGMELGQFHRLRLSPASVSVLRFGSDPGAPRVLAMNCGESLPALLR
jgi:broad specificity phosphatase PhoE